MKRFFYSLTAVLGLMVCGCNGHDNEGDKPTPEPTPKPVENCARKGSGKDIYLTSEFGGDPTKESSTYNYSRSKESENLIIVWDKAFGSDPSKAPNLNGKSMKVDVDNILDQAEEFYKLYRDKLQFIKTGSAADKYKMIIFLRYTQEGTVYGGAEKDYKIGSLWVEPSRLSPSQPSGKLDAVAHELGHSFQFQLCLDNGGFGTSGFGGGGIYEMTSQWMLWQANPKWLQDEKYHWESFMDQTHFAFMHPDNMYHTANVLEYWSSLHGQNFIADLWRSAKGSNDVVGVYKKLTGLDQEAFNDEMFDGCRRYINYDLPRVKEACSQFANRHECSFKAADADGWEEIAASRVPQQYGYNGIKLKAPKSGETVSVGFKGLSKSSSAGWRYGFVGTKTDGTIVYGDKIYSDAEGTAEFTADSDYSYLWLVVMAAPKNHIFVREDNASNYISYPYAIKR